MKKKLKIAIVVPNDRFYMNDSVQWFVQNLPEYVHLELCVLVEASPFGKRTTFMQRVVESLRIFGVKFFIKYSFRYIWMTLSKGNVERVLRDLSLPSSKAQNVNTSAVINSLSKLELDLIINIGANQVFRDELLNLPSIGCLNAHTSLLPAYRGLMPSFWVLKNMETKTGVSIFFMDAGIDTGHVLVRKQYEIKDRVQSKLIADTKKLAMQGIIEALELIAIHRDDLCSIVEENREQSGSSYYSFPTRDDVKEFLKGGNRF